MRAAFVIVLLSAGCQAGDPGTGRRHGRAEPAQSCEEGTTPPSTRVRRLTKVELQTAAAALLDDGARDALEDLEADSQLNGRYSNDDQQVASPSFLTGLRLAAEVIGENFKATVTSAAYDGNCFVAEGTAQNCAQAFIRAFGKRIYRHSITDEDVTELMVVYKAGCEMGIDGDVGDRFSTGLSWVVRAMLQAPDFLYLTELGEPSAQSGSTTRLLSDEIASALSFSVVGMLPDEPLAAAAAANRLGAPSERAEQAARLIAAHPDGWAGQMRRFVSQWLGINFEKPDWAKDTAVVPQFDAARKNAIETETNLFLDDWANQPGGARLDTLLTGNGTFVNEQNAPIYGLSITGTAFQKVSLDATERAGILTLSGFLGSSSHVAETSPVVRGKLVLERLFCREPPAPPPNVPPLPPPSASAPTTTRARFQMHLADDACRGCHELFDPMGNAFEVYDVLGAYRSTQNGFPVDGSGALVAADGTETPVASAVELVTRLAEDPEVRACVARQVFRFTMGRRELDSDACALEAAARSAVESGDLRDVVSSLVSSEAFVTRTVRQ
jgi:hypothetical protein